MNGAISITLDGYKVHDPNLLIDHWVSQGITPWWKGLVNRFDSPRGFHPGRGAVLLSAAQLDGIDLESYTHELIFKLQPSTGGDPEMVTLQKLVIVTTECVSGPPYTEDSLYLVHLVDARIFGRFAGAAGGAFNIRSPDDVNFLSSTTTYPTWTALVTALWPTAVLGALDTTHASFGSSLPENLAFLSTRAWDALEKIFQVTGHYLIPKHDGTFAARSTSYTDTDFEDIATLHQRNLIRGSNSQNSTISFLPEKIRVYFPCHNYQFQYNTDFYAPTYMEHWRPRSVRYIELNTADFGSGIVTRAGTIHVLYGSRVATIDITDAWSNQADCTIDATEVANNWVQRYVNPRHGNAIYKTAVPFFPGPPCAAVSWYDTGHGIRTQIIQDPEYVYTPGKGVGEGLPQLGSKVASADADHIPALSRETLPFDRFMVVELQDDLGLLPGTTDSCVGKVLWAIGEPPTWSYTGLPHFATVWNILGIHYRKYDRALVQWNQQWYEWQIVSNMNEVVHFELLEDKVLNTPALGKILKFDRVDTWITTGETGMFWSEYPINSMFTGFVTIPNSSIGDRGFAILRKRNEDTLIHDWSIIFMSGPAHRLSFQLVEALPDSPGTANSAPATVYAFYLYGHDMPVDGNQQITVWDARGRFRATVKNAEGFATWNDRNLRYEVDLVDQKSPTAWAELTADMCQGQDGTITGFLPRYTFPCGMAPDPLPTLALNIYELEGCAGDFVELHYDADSDTWVIIQVTHKAMQVITNLRIGDLDQQGNRYIQGLVCDIVVMHCCAECVWMDLLPLRACTSGSGS